MKKTSQILFLILILAIFVAPDVSLAFDIIPCGTDVNKHMCTFTDVITLINNVINFVLFKLALPIAALMFAYAGVKLVGSGGSPEARSSAKSIFTHTAGGLIVAAGAYLIVKTILIIAGYQSIGMFFK